jgi:hypothetical protein
MPAYFNVPTINHSGLIAHYDFTNPKSFKGRPTTNLAPYPDYSDRTEGVEFSVSGWGGDTGLIQLYRSGGYKGLPYKKLTKLTSGNGGVFYKLHNGIPIVDNNTYNVSGQVGTSVTHS